MAKRDYYEVLGVSKSATKKEIKTAYRKLAKQYHPDRNKEAGAEDRFKEVQEAYEVLFDEQKRSAYDQYGFAGAQSFGGNYSGFEGFGGFGGFGEGADFSGFGDIFEQFFGGRQSRNGPQKGRDLGLKVKLTFKEAIFGTEKELRYNRKKVCTHCKGSGAESAADSVTCATCGGRGQVVGVQQTFIGNIQTTRTCPTCSGAGIEIKNKCHVCHGNGYEETSETFSAKIPHGIPDAVTMRFAGQGDAGSKGAPAGDLFLEIEVESDDYLERKGDDIYSDIHVSVVSLVLGTDVEVPTVHGKSTLRIPAGTQSEAVLRMSGKGGPKFRGNGNGDHYVRIIGVIPKKLTKEQRKLWEELDKTKDEKPGLFEGIFG